MKKSWKAISLMLVVMLFAMILSACNNSGSKVSVGIVLPTKDEPRWVQDEQRFKDALKGTDYTTEILFSQGSSAKEKENVETLINKGIKVLIICPQDGDAAASAVEAAKKEGITVISYDRLITNTDAVDYYVTFDSLAVGAAQAQYLVDNAKGSDVPLYLYAGAASDNNAFLFFEGAWKVLQPKIADGTFKIANSSEAVALKDTADLSRDQLSKIIGQVTTNWDANEAKNKAQTHLTAVSGDLKGDVAVLAPNDGTARSIADVFSSDSAVSSFVVTGQDAEKASIQYILDSKQSMTVFKDVRTLVKDAMGMAVTILDGKKPETTGSYDNGKVDVKAKQTDVIVVDKENVKKELVESDYYKASDFTGL
ncbi:MULTISPECIES: sugar ABC transporter substrate-binding protein [unclassified Bacillus (in: firmicutes)]|uniref:sugar ABC transporter substrate-binding protein n=1 Tax=unclassified Bacillus (in: firmicutes) TaxID=185979 RepID=UPI0008EB360D|nr:MULTISPECIES: sugar-binding protein [unclassified Bacillus (in: firmicutes)]SFB14223.1 putative multiple sugar transport system substrate-binding protein [Bacillus sp. UNCCL13]SFQ89769.1 putative multiple sugar transport system substrate-binding protein [Bacillus sp. cl95]